MSDRESCEFCALLESGPTETWVLESDTAVAFLDHRPLFEGHSLLVPREHCETLADLPPDSVPALFAEVQRLARALEAAMEAEGSFIAINNRVSQSVPHLHVHIVPRRKGDGLRGFFWPRKRLDREQQQAAAARIRQALGDLDSRGGAS